VEFARHFATTAARHLGPWSAHDSLGEGLAALGDTAAAIRSYARLLELGPDNEHARQEIARSSRWTTSRGEAGFPAGNALASGRQRRGSSSRKTRLPVFGDAG